MKRHWLYFAATVCCFLIEPGTALADDCYKLIHGMGNPVCRKLGRNLNRFCDRPPMRCEIAIHPDFAKDFSFPKWEDLDPLANIELVAELVRSLERKDRNCTGECDTQRRESRWQKYRSKLLEGIQHGCIRFSRARIDINHDGQKELVFRLMGIDCPTPSDGWLSYSDGKPNLMVLDESTGRFDHDFIRELTLSRYDIILHQGRVSLVNYHSFNDTWRILEPSSSPGAKKGAETRFVVMTYPVCKYQILE